MLAGELAWDKGVPVNNHFSCLINVISNSRDFPFILVNYEVQLLLLLLLLLLLPLLYAFDYVLIQGGEAPPSNYVISTYSRSSRSIRGSIKICFGNSINLSKLSNELPIPPGATPFWN